MKVILSCFFNDPVYGSGLAGALITAIILAFGYWLQYWLFKKQIKAQNSLFEAQIKVQKEEAFKTNSLKLVMDLSKEFDDDLDEDRTIIGKYIIKHKILDRPSMTGQEYESIYQSIENVIDFFDMLGFYIKNNYIKTDLVWNNFYYWFNLYHEFYVKYSIKDFRFKDSPQVWKNLEYLRDELRKIEFAESGKKLLDPIQKSELEKFFKEEGDFKPPRTIAIA